MTDRRAFRKSWGAELGAGGTRFRLWAPGQRRLLLRFDGRDHAMDRDADGWFEVTLPGIGAGARYAFVLEDGRVVPDPAARAQEGDVHGASVVTDPKAFSWSPWQGRPWHEAVILELHIGTFTPEGTFRAAIERLPHLAETGITAIEIMPVAQFAGNRGWGYDGVLPYAPHPAYGTPDDLKALVDACHGHGLMVLLDVVYNHFGPEGSYLSAYAPDFFDADRQTPWGNAIAYGRDPVRRFFIENALYWMEEFHVDGLRLDAVDHVRDASDPELLVSIAQQVRARFPDAHLTTEDNRNITSLHTRDDQGRPRLYSAEWNDDFHNVAHVIATGETEGYYADFAEDRWGKFARALAQGFVWQGEAMPVSGNAHGEPSTHLPPLAFVDFLQNHDQTGNRALGERLLALSSRDKVRALMTIHLLSPHVPLMFMGEEWGETRPFAFFTDFHGDLAQAVRDGRRREFAGFGAFQDSAARQTIPDPNDPATFAASRIDWDRAASAEGRDWLAFTRGLLALRRTWVTPHLAGAGGHAGQVLLARDGLIAVDWQLDGARLSLRANLSDRAADLPPAAGTCFAGRPGVLAPDAVALWSERAS
ncbi:malto-oligosyltrehalose trehalohydrolase [Paracoccus hibiscisoli]|uniref:Malto-oligosyltrehalose trehalohydrolase n=1 Tax=Paracoccus hibiscisoli TaxID=2023261 RepID=A0A4U0QU11_9RHOB|nr:malto-oligosyltrehalose trehalohydrolase [Paracoccus hibiscisoli]TJZ85579.1 malto-oligosyltrehalose trehalohydrolase [Paracoccus hibiscisoli]